MSVLQGSRRAGGQTIHAHLGRVPAPDPKPQPAPDEPSVLDSAAFGEGEDLSQLTRAQLVELAGERGVTVPSRATKAQITQLIEEA